MVLHDRAAQMASDIWGTFFESKPLQPQINIILMLEEQMHKHLANK